MHMHVECLLVIQNCGLLLASTCIHALDVTQLHITLRNWHFWVFLFRWCTSTASLWFPLLLVEKGLDLCPSLSSFHLSSYFFYLRWLKTSLLMLLRRQPMNEVCFHVLVMPCTVMKPHHHHLVSPACHVFYCSEGIAPLVLATVGQAFELRFKQYLKGDRGGGGGGGGGRGGAGTRMDSLDW